MDEILLKAEGISKSFPGVKALDSVQLHVRSGKVHALMGENGAGKSTLMKTLIGIHEPDEGKIYFKGKEVKFKNTKDALNSGISMIHQELSPVLHRSVAENIWLGREHMKGRLNLIVDHKKMNEKTAQILKELEIDIDPTAKMKDLTIANMQMVEIAKAISYNAEVIIMDEPTSAITDKEVAHLFELIDKLKKNGVGIIYITHRMEEVFKIADDISIFRDGKYIGSSKASETTEKDLIKMMVGRELGEVFNKVPAEIGEVKLEVKKFSRKDFFEEVDFTVRKGEILGVAGLVGAGRSELMETVFGVYKADSGEIYIEGERVEITSPEDAISYGMAFLTEDRKMTGIYSMLDITSNTAVSNLESYENKGLFKFLRNKDIKSECAEMCEIMRVKTPHMEQKIENLSGGNQQKVLLARWLLTHPEILILDEPTRGIDVGAKAEIHKLISSLAGEGKAVIMISSELPEILGMSDRIMVMHEGRCKGIISGKDATQESIMSLATS